MPDFAPGIPDPKRFGDPTKLTEGAILPFYIQKHLARRSGPHHDIRFGRDQLISFATKKEIPLPGEKRMLYAQPLHAGIYGTFEGRLPPGYGEGTVSLLTKGEIVIQSSAPGRIVFSYGHTRHPERFALIKMPNEKSWLLSNITPTEEVPDIKKKYKLIPAEEVEKVLTPDYMIQPKVDGALSFVRLVRDKVEAMSYRKSVTGKPIVHTERLGLGGLRTEGLNDTELLGEIFGIRKGKVIPPQELGGLLNAALSKSLRTQREKQIQLKSMLFGVRKYRGKEIPPETPYPEQLSMLQEIMKGLPKDKFMLPETAETPEAARTLFERIRSGKHPLTTEGIVAHPRAGGIPSKVKFMPESDVWIRNIFPGEGKYTGKGAGGFEYALGPEEKYPIVGKVGTGLSDELRQQLFSNPEEFIGRMARIHSMGQYPSGAHRAPALIALHEDYPLQKASCYWKRKLGKLGNVTLYEVDGDYLRKQANQTRPTDEIWMERKLRWGIIANIVPTLLNQ